MTIRQVAEYVAMDKTVGSSEDGFSALRRKCQAIGFPLQESRKTSQKNRLNVLTKTDFVCHILLKVMRTIKQSAVQAVSDCIA